MAEKFAENARLSPQELAKHLRQPEGEVGKKIGEEMNKGNKHICLNTYKVLNPSDGDHILEIGMGNGLFVKNLLSMADKLTYEGLDYSSVMVKEAKRLNADFLQQGQVNFTEASIEQLPFEDNSFDRITTTNTAYFWPQPAENAAELLRVLKPGGQLIIGYRSKSMMNKLEFVKYGFKEYDAIELEELLSGVGFQNLSTQSIEEPPLEFEGKTFVMEGFFTTGVKY